MAAKQCHFDYEPQQAENEAICSKWHKCGWSTIQHWWLGQVMLGHQLCRILVTQNAWEADVIFPPGLMFSWRQWIQWPLKMQCSCIMQLGDIQHGSRTASYFPPFLHNLMNWVLFLKSHKKHLNNIFSASVCICQLGAETPIWPQGWSTFLWILFSSTLPIREKFAITVVIRIWNQMS